MNCEMHDWYPVSFEREDYDFKTGKVIFVCKACQVTFKEEDVEEENLE